MKTRLNITIEDDLLNNAKRYAEKNQTSLSQLIEHYFKSLARSAHKKNVIQLIEKLPKPEIDLPKDLKESYYQNQKEKYGF
jgi:hypothetical protein